jgi:hypothetical protein
LCNVYGVFPIPLQWGEDINSLALEVSRFAQSVSFIAS